VPWLWYVLPVVRRSFRFSHPGQIIATGFASAIALGTALLSLPIATAGGQRTQTVDALFTATSAVTITGLTTVDTGTQWSGFGHGVILFLIQIGGLGIMTFATLIALLFFNRMGLRTRFVLQAETRALTAGDLRNLVKRIAFFSIGIEAVIAIVLFLRFYFRYDMSAWTSVYHGVFHGVSAFNNAGFSLYSDSFVGFLGDPLVILLLAFAVIIGGLGFPVVFELVRQWRPSKWSVLTRVTVFVTGALLAFGTLLITFVERGNPATLGGVSGIDQFTGGFFTAVMPRSGGLNVIEMADLRPESLFTIVTMMFIGGGSAGTAGGIKVTTFGLLAYVIWAEMRGKTDVEIGRRRVATANQRQALSVALLGIGIVTAGTFLLLSLTNLRFEYVLFEAVSASATVGLSTGITGDLSDPAKVLLVLLMFVGRIGPLTVASALAMRERATRRRLPDERMIVG
jgi:trk system potassium uptake protein